MAADDSLTDRQKLSSLESPETLFSTSADMSLSSLESRGMTRVANPLRGWPARIGFKRTGCVRVEVSWQAPPGSGCPTGGLRIAVSPLERPHVSRPGGPLADRDGSLAPDRAQMRKARCRNRDSDAA
jgi:hypothetical protein